MDSSLPELDAAELRDIFGDGALDFGSEKSPPKPKRKGPRKRPPARRQAVNLDALMDGIDGEERTSTPQRSQFESRVSTPSYASPFDRLQRNVVGYLDRALEFCLSDVTAEITQMIQENDPFESCIPSFLEDLRAVLREMVALGTDSPFDKSTDVQVVFDDFGASFLNIFKQAEVIRNSNHSEKARAARLAISAVANRKSQLASDMSRLVRDVKTELVELSDMRQQATQKEGELERRQRRVRKASGELESRRLFVEAESVAAKRSLESLKEMFHKYTSLTVGDAFDDFDVGDSIRRRLSEIRGKVRGRGKIELPQLVLYDVLREKQENRAMRQAFEYSFSALVNNFAAQRPMRAPQYMQVPSNSPPRSYDYRMSVDVSNNRLQRMQERRDADLENLSRFLGKMQRKGENFQTNEEED